MENKKKKLELHNLSFYYNKEVIKKSEVIWKYMKPIQFFWLYLKMYLQYYFVIQGDLFSHSDLNRLIILKINQYNLLTAHNMHSY